MATKTTSSKSSTTKSTPKSSVTIMSKTPKAQPSTVNGVASASSIAIANAKNKRAAATEAKNRAAGVKYADDPGYAPSTGTYTTNRGSSNGGSTTYKNGVLQGTYDASGNFTPATKAQQSGVTLADEGRVTVYSNPTKYDAGGNPIRTQSTPQNIVPSTLATPGEILSGTKDSIVAPFDVTKYDLTTTEGLIAAQSDLTTQIANSDFARESRDAVNLLGDLQRFVKSTMDYTQASKENQVKYLEQQQETTLAQLEAEKQKVATLAQENIDELNAQKETTKNEFIEATIGLGGGRFSTMATGQASLDTKFAALQTKVKNQAMADLVDLGIKKTEATNFYAAKIADITLNANKQLSDLLDKSMITTRDIVLGLSDNKVKMNQELMKNKLATQEQYLNYQAKKDEAIRQVAKENTAFNIQFEQLLNSTPKGTPVQIGLPDGTIISGVGRQRIVGSGGSGSSKPKYGADLSDAEYLKQFNQGVISVAELKAQRPHLVSQALDAAEVEENKKVWNEYVKNFGKDEDIEPIISAYNGGEIDGKGMSYILDSLSKKGYANDADRWFTDSPVTNIKQAIGLE